MTTAKIEKVSGQECLVVTIPLCPPTVSSSGKNVVIAKSGVLPTGAVHDGQIVTINLSAWVNNPNRAADMAAAAAAKQAKQGK